jgi:UDP-N-acetylglucosamine 2-epimerase (non-hydrolysing)
LFRSGSYANRLSYRRLSARHLSADTRRYAAPPAPGPAVVTRHSHERPCHVAVVVGTRPEVIKMAPVIAELRRRPHAFEVTVITTAQHREMLEQALTAFHITTDLDLGLMDPGQLLPEFTGRALVALTSTFAELEPDLVLVQGDTNTVLAAALAASYERIPVGHIEAGLRSGDPHNPFPEEINRRIATTIASLHFAPTELAYRNLIHEGVPAERIVITGNTIVDALHAVPHLVTFEEPGLDLIPWEERRIILTTVHRRESFGEPLLEICRALCDLVRQYDDVHIVFPVHLNPRVRETAVAALAGHPRIDLFRPLTYPDFLEVVRRSTFVMTDSGGVQEECPSLLKPVLVLREKTERPEVLTAGFGELVGTRRSSVVAAASRLLDDPRAIASMVSGENPFGDGSAAQRIADAIERRRSSLVTDLRGESLPISARLAQGGDS